MKRLIAFIAAAMLVAIVAVGCSSRPPASDQVTPEQAAAAEATPDPRAKLVEDRQRAIEEARAVLADSIPSWEEQVRNSENSIAFRDACHQLERIDQLREVVDKMRTLDLSVPEVGMQVDQAEKYYQRQCLEVASKLFKAVQAPRGARRTTTACDGDQPYFANSMSVMNDIVELLKKANTNPSAIGTTPERLRQAMLQDVRTQIIEERQGDPNQMVWTIKQALEFWGFTPEQLGVTAEEAKQAREARG